MGALRSAKMLQKKQKFKIKFNLGPPKLPLRTASVIPRQTFNDIIKVWLEIASRLSRVTVNNNSKIVTFVSSCYTLARLWKHWVVFSCGEL